LIPTTGATSLAPLRTHGFVFEPPSTLSIKPEATTVAPIPAPLSVNSPLEAVANSLPAKSAVATPASVITPTVIPSTPAVSTSIGADGEEEKTSEDSVSVTKVKKVKKPKVETESTITVDEDESEDRVIE
jgi:hypothetical protein